MLVGLVVLDEQLRKLLFGHFFVILLFFRLFICERIDSTFIEIQCIQRYMLLFMISVENCLGFIIKPICYANQTIIRKIILKQQKLKLIKLNIKIFY